MKKFYKCKQSLDQIEGTQRFVEGRVYEFIKSMGNIVFIMNEMNEKSCMTKELFKELFNQKPIER